MPDRLRRVLYRRSDNRCERCGVYKNSGLHLSHRIARGMGGTRETFDDLSRYNLLCHRCHLDLVEAYPDVALSLGLKVQRHDTPRLVPCRTWRGWVFLTRDGRYSWPPLAVDAWP